MERIQGLKEYVQTEHYLEGIGIGKEEQKEIQITYQPLAQGEYNINYWFVHPLTGKKLVLRVNTGSQMHLENQIEYEYHALELLADSGRTPVPVFVQRFKIICTSKAATRIQGLGSGLGGSIITSQRGKSPHGETLRP